MNTWLYQLSETQWPPEMFRYEIREHQRWRWGYGNKRGDAVPDAGDTLVFFYAPTDASDPGFYGWAVVERFDKENSLIYFTPTAPTDHWKMDPWWNTQAGRLAARFAEK